MKPKLNKIKFFKLIIIALPFIINTSAKAQGIEAMIGSGANINEAFLSSLPPDLRGDLLDGQNMEDPNIDAADPKTRVTNLEASLKKAERTIDQIKLEIQSKYSNAETDLELRRFGREFFSSYQSEFPI